MTSQTKKFIELADIIGVRIECRNTKCGASLLLTDNQIMTIAGESSSTLFKCPACGSSWTIPPPDPNSNPGASNLGYDKETKQFLRMLINMREFEAKLGCHLMFEINADLPKNS